MAAPAAQFFRAQPRPLKQVRLWTVGLTLVGSVALAVGAAHLPAFLPSGGDFRNPDEVVYARNIWQQSQTSLVVLALFIPWLIYGLVMRGARWGRAAVLVLAGAGLLLGLWMAGHSLTLYRAQPMYVSGLVTRIEGRQITLDRGPTRSFYLVVSDTELQAVEEWVRPGVPVALWVAPNGQAGFIGRPGGGRLMDQK
jgi:hypothetical protein